MKLNKSTAEMFNFMAVLSTSVTLWLYLACAGAALRLGVAMPVAALGLIYAVWTLWGAGLGARPLSLILMAAGLPDWKSVVWGKRVAGGVDLGGRRIT